MVSNSAYSILTTAIFFQARINAFCFQTSFVRIAITVHEASFTEIICQTSFIIWIASERTRTLVASNQISTYGTRSTNVLILLTFINIFTTTIQRKLKTSRTYAHSFMSITINEYAFLIRWAWNLNRTVETLSYNKQKSKVRIFHELSNHN